VGEPVGVRGGPGGCHLGQRLDTVDGVGRQAALQRIQGDRQVRRSWTAPAGGTDRLAERQRDAAGLRDALGVLGDGCGHAHLIHILKGASAQTGGSAGAR